MGGRITHYAPCPRCRENGKDSRGDNLACYDDGGVHCFACKYHRNPKRFIQPKQDQANGPKSVLPSDFSEHVPGYAWQWLLQYGLPWSYWSKIVGYSPNHQRLVFKVGQPTQFSVGRYLPHPGTEAPGTTPEGLEVVLRQKTGFVVHGSNDSHRKWRSWGDCHRHCEIVNTGTDTPVVAVVEDIISAHKVGQITTAIPLFGTTVHPCHMYALTNDDRPVILWLDKDQEESVGRLAYRLQVVIGKPVSVLITDKDPKELPVEIINDLIESKQT